MAAGSAGAVEEPGFEERHASGSSAEPWRSTAEPRHQGSECQPALQNNLWQKYIDYTRGFQPVGRAPPGGRQHLSRGARASINSEILPWRFMNTSFQIFSHPLGGNLTPAVRRQWEWCKMIYGLSCQKSNHGLACCYLRNRLSHHIESGKLVIYLCFSIITHATPGRGGSKPFLGGFQPPKTILTIRPVLLPQESF